MNLGLQSRVALVTGGSEGIGLATARRLVQEGARVVICARRPEVLQQAAASLREFPGAEVEARETDVRQEYALRQLFEFIGQRFGRLDVLVNNAGTAAAMPFEKVTDEMWEEDLALKVFGAIRATRLALPLLRAAGGGSIVNLLNIGAKQPGALSLPSTLSRGAGLALTKALSKELAPERIRVNAVLIGLIKSGQHDRGWQAAGGTREAYYQSLASKKQVPLGRAGEAEEAADLIAFLASERAAYLTGTAINCDGGLCAVA